MRGCNNGCRNKSLTARLAQMYKEDLFLSLKLTDIQQYVAMRKTGRCSKILFYFRIKILTFNARAPRKARACNEKLRSARNVHKNKSF